MSALAFLSGMAQGVGEEYSKQASDQRQFKQQKDLASGQAILHELENNESLDWPTTGNLLSTYYKTMGVPDKDAQTLIQHHKGVFDHLQSQQSQSPQFKGAPATPPAPGVQGTDELAGIQGGTQGAPSLPPLPQYQQPPVTSGMLKATTQAQQQNILTEAQVNKQRELLGLLNQAGSSSGATAHENNGSVESAPTPHSKTRQGIANGNITYNQVQEQPKFQPGLVYGEDAMKEYPNAIGLQPHSWYRRGAFSDGETSHYSAAPNTTSTVVMDADSPTKWARVKVDPRNNVVGEPELGVAPPAGTISRSTVTNHVERYIDPNTNQVVIRIVPVTNTTTPNIGGPATPLSPIPSAPTGTGGAQVVTTPGSGGSQRSSGGKGAIPGLTRPFNPTDPIDNVIRMAASDSQLGDREFHKLTKPQQAQYEKRLADLDVTPNNVSNSIRERAILARGVLSHLGDINKLIDQADREGDLGVVATRWNDFINDKLGSDPTKSQIFSKLRSEQGFLSTAAAMAHGGLRGGSSPSMVSHWQQILEAKDAKTLKSKLSALTDWMTTYANMVPTSSNAVKGNQAGATPGTPVPANPTTIPQVGENFGGGKVLSVQQVQ